MFLKKTSQFLINISKSWVSLTALVIFLLFSILILPGQSAAAKIYSGEVGSPDLSFFYSADDIYKMADQYGPSGREAYVQARFSFDLAFPLIYGFFLITSIGWVLNRQTHQESQMRMLSLVPIGGIIFDFLENISASMVISRYPTLSPIFANLAPIFTVLKWVFVGGSFLILIFSGLIFMINRRRLT